MSVCSYFTLDFEANATRVLKQLNSLHGLSLTVTVAAPTADGVDKWAKSMGQTTITNLKELKGIVWHFGK